VRVVDTEPLLVAASAPDGPVTLDADMQDGGPNAEHMISDSLTRPAQEVTGGAEVVAVVSCRILMRVEFDAPLPTPPEATVSLTTATESRLEMLQSSGCP
jgi:hypothetical protein